MIDWTPELIARLGTVPDNQIAAELSVGAGVVRGMRERLGIPHTRVCLVCGKKIVARRDRNTCSRECRLERKRQTAVDRCRRKKVELAPLESIAINAAATITHWCEDCGKSYSNRSRKSQRCPECLAVARRAAAREAHHAARAIKPPDERTCAECGRLFTTSHSRQLICSEQCRLAREARAGRERRAARNWSCLSCGVSVPRQANYCESCRIEARRKSASKAFKKWSQKRKK